MYWNTNYNAIWFESNIDDAVDKLKYAFHNYENMNKNIQYEMNDIHDNYDWDNITDRIMKLCQE